MQLWKRVKEADRAERGVNNKLVGAVRDQWSRHRPAETLAVEMKHVRRRHSISRETRLSK